MSDYWQDKKFQAGDDEVAVDYLKSTNFAVHWADGVVGGLTPSGHVHLSLYAERMAIPRRVVYKLTPDGDLGEENRDKRVSREAIVRELACDVLMSLDVAEDLANWLLEAVDLAKRISGKDTVAAAKPTSDSESSR